MIDARLIDYAPGYRRSIVYTDVDFCIFCGSKNIEKAPKEYGDRPAPDTLLCSIRCTDCLKVSFAEGGS